MSLMIMDMMFAERGELAQYTSLSATRSYYGVGAIEVTADPRAPCAMELQPDRIVFLHDQPNHAYWLEELTLAHDKLTAKGYMLKGLAKRRVCVPPLSLPTRLYQYTDGAWTEISDAARIRAALAEADVYQGFARPAKPTAGMLFLDLTDLGTAYDWGTLPGLGEVVSDLGTAQLRAKYQNFGWDRFTDDAESAYLHYAMNNLIAPEDEHRAVAGLIAAENLHRGAALPWQARFDKLEALFESIGEATGIGWDIVPDYANKRFIFGAWVGADRSTGATVAVISEDMGNASSVTLKRSFSASANTAYVGGAGEDENRFILSVGGDAAGVARRELWAECGGVDDTELLRLYGQTKLDAAAPKESLTAELLDSGACRYGREYDVGDQVIVRDAFGNQAITRITAVKETYEGGGRQLSATFGDAPVTLGAVLARTQAAPR